MLHFLKKTKTSFSSLSRLIGTTKHRIVFYAESKQDYLFIGPLIEELLKQDLPVVYVTSSHDDPMLHRKSPNLTSCYIKDGGLLGYFFANIRAHVFVTTLTDLGAFHFKRSVQVDHYVYLFHSLNSAHMVYRQEAFKNYDHILSPTKYVTDELIAMENHYEWPTKNIVNGGYIRLDDLIKERRKFPSIQNNHVLIAPSWGAHGLIETGAAEKIADLLLEENYHVTVQPHPMTLRKSPAQIKQLKTKQQKIEAFTLNDDISNKAPFFTSGYLITDWSGTSYEYALTHDRPVCFIDTTAPKCRNDHYKDIDIVPQEIVIREKIGKIVAHDDIHNINAHLNELDACKEKFVEYIHHLKQNVIYNNGKSAREAAGFIMGL